MGKDIGRDAAPQQLHHGASAVAHVHTGASQLQYPSREAQQRGNVVFRGGVEPSNRGGARPLHHPVAADHPVRACAERVVHHDQVVGHAVEHVHVPAGQGSVGVRLGAHLVVEHAVAQRLHRFQLGRRRGDAQAEMAGPELLEP